MIELLTIICLLMSSIKSYVVELDSTYERYFESGISERYEYKKISIVSEKANEYLTSLVTSYTPYYNISRFDFIRIKRDGKIIDVDTSKYVDVLAPPELGGTIFWGTRNRIIELPELKKGDILEYQVSKYGGNWLGPTGDGNFKTPYPGYFNVIEIFGDEVFIKKKVYVIEELPQKPLRFQIYNSNIIKAKKIRKNGTTIYVFSARNIKPFELEPFSPSKYDIFPKLIVTNIPSWRIMSQMEFERSDPNIEPDEITKSISDSLCAGLNDIEKIRKLFYFVADEIRYLGLIETEAEGYEPHKASLTLLKRSGVCKDKAALLAALLRAQGFKAYYATTAVGMKMENIPADQTNHAIVTLETAPYEYIYLDPTIGAGGKELLPPSEWGQGVLVSRENGDTLREIPGFSKEYNLFSVQLVDSIRGDTLIFTLFIDAKGAWDQYIRERARRGPVYLKRYIENILHSIFNENVIIDDLKYTDAYNYSEYFRIQVKGRVFNYFLKVGNLRFFKPASISSPEVFIWSLGVLDKDRKSAYVTRFPYIFSFNERVNSTNDLTFNKQSFTSLRAGLYTLSFQVDGEEGDVVISLKIGMDKKLYKVKEINEFIKDFRKLKSFKKLWIISRVG